MNMQSENINELAMALSKAQGENDRFSEAILIKKMSDLPEFKKDFKKGDHINLCLNKRFLNMISHGVSDCWYWIAYINQFGYGKLSGKLAHRISWEIHNGKIPKKLQVLHKCDVRSCVNPNHLFLGNHDENMKDMAKKDRAKNRINGEMNLQHKLKENQVIEIRKLYIKIKSYSKLSILFNVSKSTIERIIRKKTWRHI